MDQVNTNEKNWRNQSQTVNLPHQNSKLFLLKSPSNNKSKKNDIINQNNNNKNNNKKKNKMKRQLKTLCFIKFSFHHKWNEVRNMVSKINMVWVAE